MNKWVDMGLPKYRVYRLRRDNGVSYSYIFRDGQRKYKLYIAAAYECKVFKSLKAAKTAFIMLDAQ